MVEASSVNAFIEDNLIVLWKKMRKVPANPDYIKIFKERNIKDELLNKSNKHDAKCLMKGDEVIGKIVAWDRQAYKYMPTKLEKEAGMWDSWDKKITTVVFKEGSRWKWFLGQKRILRYSEDDEGTTDNGR